MMIHVASAIIDDVCVAKVSAHLRCASLGGEEVVIYTEAASIIGCVRRVYDTRSSME